MSLQFGCRRRRRTWPGGSLCRGDGDRRRRRPAPPSRSVPRALRRPGGTGGLWPVGAWSCVPRPRLATRSRHDGPRVCWLLRDGGCSRRLRHPVSGRRNRAELRWHRRGTNRRCVFRGPGGDRGRSRKPDERGRIHQQQCPDDEPRPRTLPRPRSSVVDRPQRRGARRLALSLGLLQRVEDVRHGYGRDGDSSGMRGSEDAVLRWASVSSPTTPSGASERLRWKANTRSLSSLS